MFVANNLALERRHPSIILAWLSSSERRHPFTNECRNNRKVCARTRLKGYRALHSFKERKFSFEFLVQACRSRQWFAPLPGPYAKCINSLLSSRF